jgi:flagellar protein FlaG
MEGIGAVKSQVIAESQPAVSPMAVSEKVTNLPEKKTQGNPTKTPEANDAKVELIAQAMDDYVKSTQTDLKIQVNRETGNVMVKVISEESGEVIREIPAEEVLKLAEKMDEMLGALLNESV